MGEAKRRRENLGPAYGAPPTWAWHYTLGRKIPLILRDGALRDAWLHDNSEDFDNLPIPYSIWFTTAETIDPTSVPALTLDNAYNFDQENFKRDAGGAWRIGYPLPHSSMNTFEEALGLHSPDSLFGGWLRRLTSHGANRKNWRVAWVPMPILGCRIEEQLEDIWVPHSFSALPLNESGPGYGCPGVEVELSSESFCDFDGEWCKISRIVAC